MKLQRSTFLTVNGKSNLHHFHSSQRVPISELDFVSKLLDRKWGLQSPATEIQQISVSSGKETCKEQGINRFSFFNNTRPNLRDEVSKKSSFYILRDDLLHPLVNGNKARKLDALLPLLQDHQVTDLVTCGGCQSAHTAAVAVSCAERGIRSHLLLRGEQPDVLTGYNLVSTMYGNVQYIPRSRFGKVLEGEVEMCRRIAQETGVLVDPMYTLAAWETATELVQEEEKSSIVVMLHTGGTLGMFGLAQRYKSSFTNLKD